MGPSPAAAVAAAGLTAAPLSSQFHHQEVLYTHITEGDTGTCTGSVRCVIFSMGTHQQGRLGLKHANAESYCIAFLAGPPFFEVSTLQSSWKESLFVAYLL